MDIMKPVSRAAAEIRMGQFILDAEARRDAKGRLKIYTIPAGDGGGKYEIAGINDRYHPQQAARLRALIQAGKQAEAETYARDYLLTYTDGVKPWHPSHAVQAFLRDCAFNRGPTGAAKIFQRAISDRLKIDGKVGPVTLAAAEACTATIGARGLLVKLRAAREAYERAIAPPTGSRAKFWQGLVNRWDKALAFAWSLL